jgi:hypothetical protein
VIQHRGRHSRVTLLVVLVVLVVLVALCLLVAAVGAVWPAQGASVSAESLGAVGDGKTDDTSALQRALDGLSAGESLVLPAGRTFAHSDVLRVRVPGVTLRGGGTLLATDEARASVHVDADDVTIRDLTVRTAKTTRRWSAPEQSGLWLGAHRQTIVEDVTVLGAASAGVFVQGASRFQLTDVTVEDSRADGIHMTAGASHGRLDHPVTRRTGDDGIAIVSYLADATAVSDVRVASPLVDVARGGRGLSVIGGRDVSFSDVDVRDTAAAGLYVACERGDFSTRVPSDVSVDGGSVEGANTDASIDQGAVLVYNAQTEQTLSGVSVTHLRIVDTRPTASRQVGLLGDRNGPIDDVSLEDVAVIGDGPVTLLAVNTAKAGYRARGWTRDGRSVPDRSGTLSNP